MMPVLGSRVVSPRNKEACCIGSTRALRIWAIGGLLLIGLIWGEWEAIGRAQNAGQIFLPAPRALRQRLARAQKALAEERFTDAVADLGAILSGKAEEGALSGDQAGQDYFLLGAGEKAIQSSLKGEVLRLIGQLPDKGMEVYELQYGDDARALVEEALAERDVAKLTDVTRKYFHTAAGYEAGIMLGRWHLDQGQPLAAALAFLRVHQSPRARQKFDPDLSLLLAASWSYAGQSSAARTTLLELKERLPNATFAAAGEEIRLFARGEEALDWLQKLVGRVDALSRERIAQWTVFRGDPARNGTTPGSPPLLHPRWRAMVEEFNDEQVAQQLVRKASDQGQVMIPSLQPLAVGDTLVMRTPEKVVGVSYESGKVIWEFPWNEMGDGGLPQVVRGEDRRGTGLQRENELSQRIWDDWAYGQVSSDGESVFALDKLGMVLSGNNMMRQRLVMQGGMLRPNAGFPNQYNQLLALDLKREGALRWAVGDENGWDEPRLAGAFFLGAPLPFNGQLYALAEINAEIRLVVLNPRTGELDWSQQIAHVEGHPILIDSVRRLAGATPSYSDGVLVCPTSSGAVVAIDLATRSLLWGYLYSSNTSDRSVFENQYGAARNNQATSRWIDSTATIVDGKVLLTPVDSNELHCLDLVTGKPVWPPKRREQNLADMLFVAGVHQDVVMLVGKRSAMAWHVSTGKEAWAAPIEWRSDRSELPCGRGLFTGQYYYLPMANNQLLKIDLLQGKVAERIPTSGPLGNLVGYRDEVISLGVNYLSIHAQVEPLRIRVAERLAKEPRDPWALARRGELFLHEQKPREAFESLLAAREVKPEDDGIATLLVDSFLAALDHDFAGMSRYVERVEPMMTQPAQRMRFLRLRIAGAQRQGELAEAFASCLKLADLVTTAPGTFEPLEQVTPHWTLHRDRWLRTRLAELLTAATGPARQAMDRVVQERLAAATKSPSPNPVRQFVNYFDSHPLALPARMQLAERLAASNDLLEAELLLLPLAAAGDSRVAAQATWQLAKLYEQGRFFEDAAVRYQQLVDRWPDEPIANGKTGRQAYAELPEESPIRRVALAGVVWPAGQSSGKEAPNDNVNFPSRVQPNQYVYVRNPVGRFSDRILEFDPGHSLLMLRDRTGSVLGRVSLLHSMQSNASGVAARSNGHLLLFTSGVQPLAVDLFRAQRNADDALLWPREIPEPTLRTAATAGGTATGNPLEVRNDKDAVNSMSLGNISTSLGPLSRHGVLWLSRGLQCFDPISGQVIWSRSDVPTSGEILGDDEVVIVVNRNSSDVLANTNEVAVFRTADGQELARYTLPEHGGRWANLGRVILLWRDAKSGPTIVAWDAVAQRELWSESFAVGARGTVAHGSEVVVVEPSGRGLIRALDDPTFRLELSVEPETQMTAVYALRADDQYFLVVNRTPTAQPSPYPQRVFGGLYTFGKLYAIDPRSGQNRWPAPAILEGATWSPNQPAASPFLVFFGHPSIEQAQKAARASMMFAVLCLDKATGREVFSKRDIPPGGTTFDVLVNVETKTVRVGAGTQTFDVTYTDAPRPPEPPVQNWSMIGK